MDCGCSIRFDSFCLQLTSLKFSFVAVLMIRSTRDIAIDYD